MRDGVHIRLTLTRGVKFTSGMDPRLNTAGPTLIVLAEHKPPVYDKAGITLVTSSVRRFPPDCLDPKIHHNNLIQSILAKIEANARRRRRRADARHARLRRRDERDARVPRRSRPVCARRDRRLPRRDHARGGARALRARTASRTRSRDLSLTEVYRADEVFCTGTMGELAAVTRVDGRGIGSGSPGR